jgi:hypothetical protein
MIFRKRRKRENETQHVYHLKTGYAQQRAHMPARAKCPTTAYFFALNPQRFVQDFRARTIDFLAIL